MKENWLGIVIFSIIFLMIGIVIGVEINRQSIKSTTSQTSGDTYAITTTSNPQIGCATRIEDLDSSKIFIVYGNNEMLISCNQFKR